MKSVVAVIPTYNEAENILLLLDMLVAVFAKLPDYRLDILVMDDSSPDGTGELVRGYGRNNKSVHLLKGQKAGLGNAYLRGFRHVLRRFNADVLVMMDADMSHDPHTIPHMLAAIEGGADYVIGSRYVHGGTIPGNWPLRRIINSRVANFVARLLAGFTTEVADTTGGFKAIRVDALKNVDMDTVAAKGYVFQVSLLSAFVRAGAVVQEVPIRFVDRRYGVSKMRAKDILEFVYRCYQINPHSKVRQFVRFATVGATGTAVNLLTLFLLVHELHVAVLAGAVAAIELSIISNFFLNERYTFQSADNQGAPFIHRLTRFNAGALIGAGVAFAVLALLYSGLGLFYIVADMLAIGVAMGWNYWMSTRFVWRISKG